ncbi:MAG: hypothetical protein AAF519_01535 [Bacteroidota bacterium]
MTILDKVTTLFFANVFLIASNWSFAQEKTDSLILNVGKSQIVFLIKDKADLAKLQNYDLNEILDRLSLQLTGDSTLISTSGVVSDTTVIVDKQTDDSGNYYKNTTRYDDEKSDDSWRYDDDERDYRRYTKKRRRTYTRHSFNVEIGTNNYLEDGQFPGENNRLYAVRPWGSWYVALTSAKQTYFGNSFYLDWGPSVSWYNFKFENDATRIIDGDQITFIEANEPDVDYEKSKLTAAYVNVHMVPMFSIGHNRGRGWKRYKDSSSSNFRIGVGGYVGYRISSYSKIVTRIDGDKEKDKDKDSFNMTDLRYGVRAQLGFGDMDIFFNYDLNELFNENQGPELNAFSIGLIF